MHEFRARGLHVMVVSECKGTIDMIKATVAPQGFKVIGALRKSTGPKDPGGGVCILVDKSTRLVKRQRDPNGLIWGEMTPKGGNPINVLGVYLPTIDGCRRRGQHDVREQMMDTLIGWTNSISASRNPSWIAMGDFNLRIGNPRGWKRNVEIDKVKIGKRDTASAKMIRWLNRTGVRPTQGQHSIALHTSFVPPSRRVRARGDFVGKSEIDFILTCLDSRALEDGEPPTAQIHRLIAASIRVPPPLDPSPPPPHRDEAPQLKRPEYRDSQAKLEWSKDIALHARGLRDTALDEDIRIEDKLEKLNSTLIKISTENLTKERVIPRYEVKRKYEGRDVPPEATILFEQSRGLLRIANQSTKGAAIYLRRVALRFRMKGAAIAREDFDSKLGRAASELLKHDSSAFYKIMKDGVDPNRSADVAEVPPDPEGVPAHVAFRRDAMALLQETRADSDIPALGKRDYWRNLIRREGSEEAFASCARPATPADFFGILFGCGAKCSNECLICDKLRAQASSACTQPPMGVTRPKKRLKTSKAWKDIPSEILAWMKDFDYDDGESSKQCMAEAFTAIFNQMLLEQRAPTGFADAILTPMLKPPKDDKEPDPRQFSNYRLISLIGLVNKACSLLLTDRLSHAMYMCGALGPEQAGFVFGQSTETAHFWQTHVTRRAPTRGHPIYTIYMDVVRAYDTVHHGALAFALEAMGVPSDLVALIKSMTSSGSGTVRVNGVESEPFPMTKGVPQGNPLSCILFAAFISSLPRYLDSFPELHGYTILGVNQKIQLYADDGAPSCVGRMQAELLLYRVRMWMKEWGLELNCKKGKTEFALFGKPTDADKMPLGAPPNTPPYDPSELVYFTVEYKYLGASIEGATPSWTEPALKQLTRTWGQYEQLRHSSSLYKKLSTAQQLQIRNAYMSLYLGAYAPTKGPFMVEAERKAISSLQDILGIGRVTRKSGKKSEGSPPPLPSIPEEEDSVPPSPSPPESPKDKRKGPKSPSRPRRTSSESHLLTYAIGGADHPLGICLGERVRVLLSLRFHDSRKLPDYVPRPHAVRLFDALWVEARPRIQALNEVALAKKNGTAPSPKKKVTQPFNFIAESHELLMPFEDVILHPLAEPDRLGRPPPEWAHENKVVARNAKASISYLKLKKDYASDMTDGDYSVFDRPPLCTGGTKHARFLTADMSAPLAVLRKLEGVPFSYMGAGLRNPLTLASEGNLLFPLLIDALRGALALQLQPWNPNAPPRGLGREVSWLNHHSSRECALCGQADGNSVYHLASECTHEAMATLRPRLRRSMAHHVKRLRDNLCEIISDNETLSERYAIPEAEDIAFDGVFACLSRGLPPPAAEAEEEEAAELEVRLYTYRLLLAAPWSARNAAPSHRFASALGRAFDQLTPLLVPDRTLRKPSTLMCKWAERWLGILSKAYSGVLKGAAPPSPPTSDEEVASDDEAHDDM